MPQPNPDMRAPRVHHAAPRQGCSSRPVPRAPDAPQRPCSCGRGLPPPAHARRSRKCGDRLAGPCDEKPLVRVARARAGPHYPQRLLALADWGLSANSSTTLDHVLASARNVTTPTSVLFIGDYSYAGAPRRLPAPRRAHVGAAASPSWGPRSWAGEADMRSAMWQCGCMRWAQGPTGRVQGRLVCRVWKGSRDGTVVVQTLHTLSGPGAFLQDPHRLGTADV